MGGLEYSRYVTSASLREGWECSLVEEDLEVSSLLPTKDYTWRRKPTIGKYIENHPINEVCMGRNECGVQVDSCGGGTQTLTWRRRAAAPVRERRGR